MRLIDAVCMTCGVPPNTEGRTWCSEFSTEPLQHRVEVDCLDVQLVQTTCSGSMWNMLFNMLKQHVPHRASPGLARCGTCCLFEEGLFYAMLQGLGGKLRQVASVMVGESHPAQSTVWSLTMVITEATPCQRSESLLRAVLPQFSKGQYRITRLQ